MLHFKGALMAIMGLWACSHEAEAGENTDKHAEFMSYIPYHQKKCAQQQAYDAGSFVDCIYANVKTKNWCTNQLKKKWVKLTRSIKGQPPKCYQAYPPYVSVAYLTDACTSASFDQYMCLDLTYDFLAKAHGGGGVTCDDEEKKCWDHSVVHRDPSNNCEFEECPPYPTCPKQWKLCPDGSKTYSDPFDDCNFDPCCCTYEDMLKIDCGNLEPACCEDGSWTCPHSHYHPTYYDCAGTDKWFELTGNTKNNPPFGEECKVFCPADVKHCWNGSTVSRNAKKNCQFDDCPDPPNCNPKYIICPDGSKSFADPYNGCKYEPCKGCKTDILECSDGTYVKRDPKNNCDFEDCPEPTHCDYDYHECADGTHVHRDPYNDCEFTPCPCCLPEDKPHYCKYGFDPQCCADGEWACPPDEKYPNWIQCGKKQVWEEVDPFRKECKKETCKNDKYLCPDKKTYVTRNPNNHCYFHDCPIIKQCNNDFKKCYYGKYVTRNPYNNCEFYDCPETQDCDNDVNYCPGGKTVGRNPYNNCEFYKCPVYEGCNDEYLICVKTGTKVYRDPYNNCAYHKCPLH